MHNKARGCAKQSVCKSTLRWCTCRSLADAPAPDAARSAASAPVPPGSGRCSTCTIDALRESETDSATNRASVTILRVEISVLWLARVARRQGGAAVAAGLEQLAEAVHAGGYAVLADKVAVALTQGEVPGLLGAEARGPLRRPLRRVALRHTNHSAV